MGEGLKISLSVAAKAFDLNRFTWLAKIKQRVPEELGVTLLIYAAGRMTVIINDVNERMTNIGPDCAVRT